LDKLTKLTSIYNSDSPIFIELFKTFSEENLDEVTQLKIEKFLMNQAQILIDKTLARHRTGNKISIFETKFESKLVKQIIDSASDFKKLITNYKTNIKEVCLDNSNLSPNHIIYSMDTTDIISYSYGRLLRVLSNYPLINKETKLLDVSLSFGKDFISKYLLARYRQENTDKNITYLEWLTSKDKNVELVNDSEFVFKVGSKLLNWLLQLEFVQSTVKVLSKTEKVNILVPGDKIKEFFYKVNKPTPVLILPHRIPMIVKPKLYKWNRKEGKYSQLGGYLLNGEMYSNEIILLNWELSSKSTLLSDNIVCSMVNKINSVGFRINSDVLDFILNNNKRYNFFIDKNYIHPLALKNKLNSSELKELESFHSKNYLEQNILGLALLFKDIPTFYMPVRLDYRGRLYCITEYLNYQGIDLAKSLLEFSSGEKVHLSDETSRKYFKIYGSNCYGQGLNKQSFYSRLNWVNENIDNILDFENGILISQAENKLLFVAFCFEFRKYIRALNEGVEYFITNLPIQFDATCNGFQHLTLMIDEVSLSKELNLSPQNWAENPSDFYSFVALKVKDYFLKQLNTNKILSTEQTISYRKLYELNIHRSLIKKAVMTIPYNVSSWTILEYIKEEFNKTKNPKYKQHEVEDYYIYSLKTAPSVLFNELDFKHLRDALNIVIFIDYPKLSSLLNYLKDIAKVSNKLKIPIPWILPTGLVVNQQFYKKKTIRVKPFIYTKNVLNLTVAIKDKFNESKQKTALMPNLVHSLDAASLGLVIENYFKVIDNKNFYSIHDCFAVPCNNAKLLTNLIKSAYCILYTDNKYLLDFDVNFINSIKNYYGENNVTLDLSNEILSVYTNEGYISVKYPSLNSIIKSKISQIDISESLYLIN
jgi:DNA-directed RNA polymerase